MRLWRAAAGFAREDYARLRREAALAGRCCAIGAELGARQHLEAVARHAKRHVRVIENLVAAGPLPHKVQRGHERLLALVARAGDALDGGDPRGFCGAMEELVRLVDRHESDERPLLAVAREFHDTDRG